MSAPIIIHGPCQVEHGALKFITQDAVQIDLSPETFDIRTDAFGTIDQRLKARLATVRFTPSGQWTGEALTLISAASGRVPGTSILSNDLVIKPLISPQLVHTIGRAGATAIPDLQLSATRTLFGSLTYTGLAKVDSTTGQILTQSAYSGPSSTFTPGNIITEPWLGSYGVKDEEGEFTDADHSLMNIDTEDGWTIRTQISTENLRADSWGIVDIAQTNCEVTASCKPLGVTEAEFLQFIERTVAPDVALRPGMSFAWEAAASLYLQSRSGTYRATLSNCGARAGSMAWGSTRNRLDGITFNAIRRFTTGAAQPLLSFEVIGG